MHARTILERWVGQALEPSEVREYLDSQVFVMDPSIRPEDKEQIAGVCFDLYLWATRQADGYGLVDAIVENDLKAALECASGAMRHGGLWVVMIFLYNCSPRGWNKKED